MDDDFLKRLHEAALRARASGFDGVADAIEEIMRRELKYPGAARSAKTQPQPTKTSGSLPD